jgi:hypothetical protein
MQEPPKCTQIGIFRFKLNHLATRVPISTALNRLILPCRRNVVDAVDGLQKDGVGESAKVSHQKRESMTPNQCLDF